ncbi:MAG: sigma-70 family RNA polymerase sigma factor [Agriterribacter sp.]
MRNDIRINYCWEDFVLNESRESYYELYKHYYAYLCYIGLKKGIGTETVKDTINDVFLYLWEKRRTLGHIRHPHNYILTFFHRSIVKKIEQSGKIQGETIENIDEIHRHFTEPSIEENILDKENNKRLSVLVNRHLNYLPRQQREIMYQKFFLGLSYMEIAKANKLSVNTVYNTVYAAMQKLRSSLPARVVASLISACIVFFLFFF